MKKVLLGLAVELMIPVVMLGVLAAVVIGVPRLVGGRAFLAVPLWIAALGAGCYLVYRISRFAGRIYRR